MKSTRTPQQFRHHTFVPLHPNRDGLLQRQCACGGTPAPAGECEECRKRRLQREIGGQTSEDRNESPVPKIVHEVMRSAGEPLDAQTRRRMEPRFGHDFSRVRIHADAQAAKSARAVNAQAYTVRNHVAFEAGQYAPRTFEGEKLLAHELAHTIQQGEAKTGGPLEISRPNDPAEREAEAASRAVLAGRTFATSKDLQPSVARQQAGNSGIADECAHWFADPQSITKRAAEEYVQTAVKGSRGVVNQIKCASPTGPGGAYSCYVYFSDGTDIEVYVRRDRIVVGPAPDRHGLLPRNPYMKVCWYDYRCPPSGVLVLTKRQCGSFSGSSPAEADVVKSHLEMHRSAGAPPPSGE